MDIGLVLQTSPPSARVVDLAKRAEAYGFSHIWTFDSHILWQEPYVIYSQILAQTRNVIVGPMVTNPATRVRETFIAASRAGYGTEAWDATANAGAALGFLDAIAYALGEPRAESVAVPIPFVAGR